MFGWLRPAALCASRRNRSTNWSSVACRSFSIFSATRRPSSWSSARYTSAIPPAPSFRWMTYRRSKTRLRSVSVVAIRLRLRFRARREDGLHERLRDRGGDLAAEPVQLVLQHHRARDLRIVRGREEDEPRGVDVLPSRLGGAGLARDLDPRDRRRRARAALDDLDHHVG